MHITLSCYQMVRGKACRMVPVCPGVFDWGTVSRDAGKARQRVIERVRKEAPKLPRAHFSRLVVPAGRLLERVQLELKVSGEGDKKHVAGWFPVVIEPRVAGEDRSISLFYHPLRPNSWFELDSAAPLGEQVRRAYTRLFEPDDDFSALKVEAQDKLVSLRIDVEPPSLFDLLSKEQPGKAAGFGRDGELDALLRVSVNQTARAADGRLHLGVAREPYRTRLQQLACGPAKTPLLVVAAPGAGKSTLIARLVRDLLEADGYLLHRNLDRVHNVLALRGRHIIAGMSYVGQWEARCVELLERARKRRLVLWTDDVHAWGKLGRTTASERSLADFFRGPLARRDLFLIGECTPEQLSVLERDAPALASCFARIHLEPASAEQTLGMLLHEGRRLEAELEVAFEPGCFRSILDYSGSLYRNLAFPGKALSPLSALAKQAAGADEDGSGMKRVTPEHVLRLFCRQTGLPQILLTSEPPLARAALERELGQQIMGQPAAIEAAADLVLSIRARTCAAGRPYGVLLLTGPTGTGKTELAKCLAEYLYGDARRLLRFDMGEFNTALSPGRLIGDQNEPEGLLTRAVRAQPFSLLLLDEIEKAHPLVLNLMLQVFDEGRLADARGLVSDFTHTVIVLTSNLGSDQKGRLGFSDEPAAVTSDVARAVREFFPPELFNRIDRVVAFQPLERGAARKIAQKELAQLAARPGLAHRGIFLRITESAVEQVLADGFDARYGARSLKRHIDRAVGDLLAQAIAGERSAEMRLLWLYRAEQGLAIRTESLREAEPADQVSPMEALLSQPAGALRQLAPAALAALQEMERDGRLEQLGARIHDELARFRTGHGAGADPVHHLDALRSHVLQLKRRLEALVAADPELQELDRKYKRSAGQVLAADDYTTLAGNSIFTRRGKRARPPKRTFALPRNDRRMLADLAEVAFLERLVGRADAGAEHVALIDLLRLAAHHERRRFSGGNPGLLEWLAEAYSTARGRFEQGAVTLLDGSVLPARSLEEFRTLLELRPRQAALTLVGPGVRQFFAGETGCHVRRANGYGPEIVRVLLLPGERDAVSHLSEHGAQRQAFEAGLEGRGPAVPNHEELLPIVRSIAFDPRGPRASLATIEDYRFSYIGSRRVRALTELLQDFWLLSVGAQPSTEPSS